MGNTKTAISIEDSLLRKADKLSREMQIPRSRLFSLALKEFIEERESRILLAKINSAYQDDQDQEEEERLTKMKRKQKKMLEGEW